MIMLERSWPALLSFFSLSIIILFSLSACPSCRGPSVISFGDPPLLALQVLSVRLPVPWLHTHPVTQTMSPPGLALAAGQTRPGYRVMPPWTLPRASVGVDGGLGLGKGLLFFP
jgi:hypothetical protein